MTIVIFHEFSGSLGSYSSGVIAGMSLMTKLSNHSKPGAPGLSTSAMPVFGSLQSELVTSPDSVWTISSDGSRPLDSVVVVNVRTSHRSSRSARKTVRFEMANTNLLEPGVP